LELHELLDMILAADTQAAISSATLVAARYAKVHGASQIVRDACELLSARAMSHGAEHKDPTETEP
jgi:hypothetical protein